MSFSVLNKSLSIRFAFREQKVVMQSALSLLITSAVFAVLMAVLLHRHPIRLDFYDHAMGGIKVIYTYSPIKTIVISSLALFLGQIAIGAVMIAIGCRKEIMNLRKSEHASRDASSKLLHKKMQKATILATLLIATIGIIAIVTVAGLFKAKVNTITNNVHITNQKLIEEINTIAARTHQVFPTRPNDWRYYLPGWNYGKITSLQQTPFSFRYQNIYWSHRDNSHLYFLALGGAFAAFLFPLFSFGLLKLTERRL